MSGASSRPWTWCSDIAEAASHGRPSKFKDGIRLPRSLRRSMRTIHKHKALVKSSKCQFCSRISCCFSIPFNRCFKFLLPPTLTLFSFGSPVYSLVQLCFSGEKTGEKTGAYITHKQFQVISFLLFPLLFLRLTWDHERNQIRFGVDFGKEF